jgi:hypothetical protein
LRLGHPRSLLVALLVLAAVAHAEGTDERTHFEVGVRAGFSFPLGDSTQGKALSDEVGPSFPLTFELGARLFGHYELALVGEYAIGSVNSNTSSGCYTGTNACTASTGQVGGEFLYHPLGLAGVDPYFGVGSTYEWLIIRATVQGKDYNLSLGGWNWVVVQTGVEFPLGKLFRVGPYFLASVGQYETSSYTVPSTGGPVSGSASVAHPAVHLWLSVGIRLVLLP